MRKYTIQNRIGFHVKEDANISLQDVFHMTDYTDQEFDDIASMQVGEEMHLGDGIFIKRTE